MIAFFFIIGTHFFSWGSEPVPAQMRCGHCGTVGNFTQKKGMRFITLFFIVPIVPISGVRNLMQCGTCGTKYHTNS
ncbi:MAG: zinc ribbon domain-containing protein [Acidobacteriota bacterium]|nr:zinc ribbon domain-containing protein [Acidobacteriota bacterium]